jgi:glycerol-3-phosphate acyltransferase PlsY
MLYLLSLILVSYFVGAIPFAFIVGRIFKNVDLRKHGSGNLGSTNAFRVLGVPLGILVEREQWAEIGPASSH